ncbi:thioredoxin-dependent thiol peroxidase [Coprobacter tertius]|uniref:thioredoxin-dependent peroxiredoxin n=1 Tax=Coprobacter tertius TaxID=2944915 RepID=A0ABT1MES1_9BACT|nr:thioredoxin-dependent thiol peroxidase [Coprobacter tertius]MCP9611125.1 thioredoxin-dependent thiol peroxidase [Coprobacter tertius]
MALKIGDKIPDILGINQDGKELKASDFTGRKIALYFYPKDNTPGCTAEACSLRDGYENLRSAGYEVIGVSKDSVASHRKFADKESLPFDLVADTDTSLNQIFGVWALKKMAGREYMGTVRTTFLIDENGVIQNIITKVDTKDHAKQILNL